MGTEAAIAYPHGSCVLGSLLLCYCQPGDVVAVLAGFRAEAEARLTGATVASYSDAASLARIVGLPRPRGSRLVAVLEGTSAASELAPLPNLIVAAGPLAHVIVDETGTLGLMGSTGRGALERHGLESSAVDMVVGSFEPLGGVGGFVVGRRDLVEHQRLASPAYSFSAASPAFTAAAAAAMLAWLADNPAARRHLSAVARRVHRGLVEGLDGHAAWRVLGDPSVATKTLHWRGPGHRLPSVVARMAADGLQVETTADSTVRIHLRHTMDHATMDRLVQIVARA